MNQSSSFGTYEALRVLIPGFYFSTLLLFLYWCSVAPFFPHIPFGKLSVFVLFSAVTIVAGLTLYAKETTKRRKAFLENQPSLYLKNKARTMADVPVVEDGDARRLYFYILNNHVPPVFHEKIFFFGTIYHIMTEIRRTSFWFAVFSAVLIIIEFFLGFYPGDIQTSIGFSLVIWLVYLLNVRYNKADRKMQENYQDQIYWLEMNNDLVENILRKRFTSSALESK